MNLLTLNQVKMLKSASKGYLTAILNLQPAFRYKGNNTCPQAGKCKAICLQYTGRNRFNEDARVRKTKLYYDDQCAFYQMLVGDIRALLAKAEREDLIPAVRLNGLSDVFFEQDTVSEGKSIFQLFPDLTFWDYTKHEERMLGKLPPNYHLTYSLNEKTSPGFVEKLLKAKKSAAFVYVGEMPRYHSVENRVYPVISGDDHDLRFLDKPGRLVGLRYKLSFNTKEGKAYRPTKSNGFLTVIQEST